MREGIAFALVGVLSVGGIGAVVVRGTQVAERMPPEPVVDRRSHRYEVCTQNYVTVYDSNDNPIQIPAGQDCHWQTDYYLISERGATCGVSSRDYATATRGALYKCRQLFGWRGGATLTERPGMW